MQKEGLKPEGAVGEIKMLKLESKKYPGELWTANRPVFVQFMVSTTILIFSLIHSNSTEAREGEDLLFPATPLIRPPDAFREEL